MLPRSGDVLHVGKAASVQFMAPMLFRVIRLHDWTTYEGWIWIDGYELNSAGDAVERRSIFVQIAGLRHVGKAPDPATACTCPYTSIRVPHRAECRRRRLGLDRQADIEDRMAQRNGPPRPPVPRPRTKPATTTTGSTRCP